MKKFLLFIVLPIMVSFSSVSCGDDDSSDEKNSSTTTSEEETVDISGKMNGYNYVDLGLPSGLKWAVSNVGTTSPTECGSYFAWSEVEPKTFYDSAHYKWIIDPDEEPIKYSSDFEKHKMVNGNVVLDSIDDVAWMRWRKPWRMPTVEEQIELVEYCNWKWVDNYQGSGMTGCIGTSKMNGNKIFFPYAGWRSGMNLYSVGTMGGYWSSSHDGKVSFEAFHIRFYNDYIEKRSLCTKENGLSVRAVFE